MATGGIASGNGDLPIAGTARADGKPSIVIYGVGQYGQRIARLAIDNGWTIVAAYNRAGGKVGKDLGGLIGLDRDLGVIVEDCETADFAKLDADIGVVAMTNVLRNNMPAYLRLMGAGLNVICHGSESYYPFGSDADAAAEIDALARRSGVTFTGGGIWDMSRIWSGILLLGPCTQVASLFHSSITDAAGQLINVAQAEQMGIGLTVGEFDARGLRKSPIAASYTTIPQHVLDASGYTVTRTRTLIEPIIFDAPIDSALMGRTIAAGLCVGTRIIGEVETAQGVTARAEIELRLFREGEVEHMFWEVDGKPRTRVRVERDDSAHATAACLFNRIPDVIAAVPGIVPVSRLGPLKPSAPTGNAPVHACHQVKASADELMAAARRESGIDIADPDVAEPLAVLLRSVNTESELHAQGALEMEGKLIRMLANRLRMARDLAAHPEIADEPILAPIMLGGVPRTGTTKLHKLLAATGDFNWLPLWQNHNPSLLTGDRSESPEPRISDAEAYWDRFNTASPESWVAHPFEIHEPEEESHILEHSFLSAVPFGYTNVPSYLAWLAEQNVDSQFDYLRRTLQYLQWQGLHQRDRRWALKSPINVAMQPALLRAFPDALLVITHRDPANTVASFCSLLNAFHKPFSLDPVDSVLLMEAQAIQLNQNLDDREAHADLDILDLDFHEVTRNGERAVERIYTRAGLSFSDIARSRVREWEDTHPPHGRGVHRYTLADFDIQSADIDARFGRYRAFLKDCFAPSTNDNTRLGQSEQESVA